MSRKKRKKKQKLSAGKSRRTKRGIVSTRLSSDIDVHLRQAIEYHQAGNLRRAEKIYRKILKTNPANADALHLLGFIAFQKGKNEVAVNLIKRAIQSDPTNPVYYNDLGNMLQNQEKLKEAVLCYEKAIQLKSDYVEAYSNMGLALSDQRQLDKAMACYEKALELNPDLVAAYNHMGSTLQDLARFEEAITFYQKALQKNPDYERAHYNLGSAFQTQGKFEEAIFYYNNAIRLDPNLPQAYFNIGNVYSSLHKPGKAVGYLKKALGINPSYAEALSALVYELQKCCSWKELSELNAKLDDFVKIELEKGRESPERPFINISRCTDLSRNFAIAKSVSTQIVRRLRTSKIDFSFEQRKLSGQKITVGYLSNNFRNHPMAHLMASLFGLHDREMFKIICYSYGKDDESDYRKRISENCDKFIDVSMMSDSDAAARIFKDKVDILVDLNGYTTENRISICAFRPAPVQVRYLGLAGTTGSDFIDYIITDRIVTPEDTSGYYSEHFVYMPHSYQVNDQAQPISKKEWKKVDFGLPESGFVFCSFNTNYKIDPVIFETWMSILRRVPDSVLWLLRGNKIAEKNLREMAKAKDVAEERLVFSDGLPKEEHLARLKLSDLALDTRIVTGAATTSDALWAGVPVITLQGSHFASRMSSSILTAIGLLELITYNQEEYEAMAVRLAQHPELLEKIRNKLRKNRSTEPLFDTSRFTRNLESAYKKIWKIFLNGEKPRRIAIEELQVDRQPL
jgi:protein O-GlcNAc transferase